MNMYNPSDPDLRQIDLVAPTRAVLGGRAPSRVAIVSRHRLCREALALGLERTAVIGPVAASLPDEETILRLAIDVIVVDSRLPGAAMQARRLCGQIAGLGLVMYGAPSENAVAEDEEARTEPFIVHVPRDSSAAELAIAVQRSRQHTPAPGPQRGGIVFRVLPTEPAKPARPQTPPYDTLTPREGVVLELASEGLANREIAQALRISEATVKNHMHRILDKMGARRRSEAAALFRRSRAMQPIAPLA